MRQRVGGGGNTAGVEGSLAAPRWKEAGLCGQARVLLLGPAGGPQNVPKVQQGDPWDSAVCTEWPGGLWD